MYLEPNWWYPYPKYKPANNSIIFVRTNNNYFMVCHYEDNTFFESESGSIVTAKIIQFMLPSDRALEDNNVSL